MSLFIVAHSIAVQACLCLFLVLGTIFIKAEINGTESLLLETQDFAVEVYQFPQLAKDHAYDLGELKVALYEELSRSNVQPYEIVSINFASNDVSTYAYLLKINQMVNES